MINIMFCGNDKVFDGALTCALSIMKRSKLTEPLKFYLLIHKTTKKDNLSVVIY